MKLIKSLTIITLVLLFLTGLSNLQAQTFYVDQNHISADDDNLGTEASPWLTIQKAANELTAGQTVLVKNGIYTELYSGPPNTTKKGIKPQRSGVAGSPITYKAFPGHSPIIDQGGTGSGFYIYNKDYITISGFEIRNVFWAGVYTKDLSRADTVIEIVVENNKIHQVNGAAGKNVGGIKFDNCENCIARENEIYDVFIEGNNDEFGIGGNGAAIHSYSMRNVLIENNEFYNVYSGVFHKQAAGALHSTAGIKGALIKGNKIHDVVNGIWYSKNGTDKPPHKGQEVTQNVIYNAEIGVIGTTKDSKKGTAGVDINYGLHVWNNVFHVTQAGVEYEAYNDINIYNNVTIGPYTQSEPGGIRYMKNTPSSSTVTLIDRNAYIDDQRFTYALYSNVPGEQEYVTTLEDWQAYGFDLSSLYIDTKINPEISLFVDIANRDYRLAVGSPLIGAGIDGVNIGAYPDSDLIFTNGFE